MTTGRLIRTFVGLACLGVLMVFLAAVFSSYQNPHNVVQWLMLLQLCR
jgi:hypothetical protein